MVINLKMKGLVNIKKISILVLSFVLLLGFSTNVFAAEKTIGEQNKQILVSEPNNSITFKKVEIIKESDKTTVSVDGHVEFGDVPKKVQIEVDAKKGTYKTKLLSVGPIIKNPTSTSDSASTIQPMSATELRSAAVTINSIDPAYWSLARTTQYLNWNVWSDGTVGFSSRSLNTWDGQPTQGGTYWYLNWISFQGDPWYTSNYTMVGSDLSSQHYNYDFGLPNLVTYANHNISIYGLSTGYDFNATYSHSGEFSSLLSAQIWYN